MYTPALQLPSMCAALSHATSYDVQSSNLLSFNRRCGVERGTSCARAPTASRSWLPAAWPARLTGIPVAAGGLGLGLCLLFLPGTGLFYGLPQATFAFGTCPTCRLTNTQFALEELRAIVEEAEACGTYVCGERRTCKQNCYAVMLISARATPVVLPCNESPHALPLPLLQPMPTRRPPSSEQ